VAEFESQPSGHVTNTVSHLEAEGFPSSGSPAFTCHLATHGGTVIGMAFHFFTYVPADGRTVYLEDLFVESSWRSRGVGKRLFAAVAEWAIKAGCSEVNFTAFGWNEKAKRFYAREGAVNRSDEEQVEVYRLSGPALRQMASGGQAVANGGHV